MAGNVFGKILTVTSFGESHGPAVGCIVDGCPAGISLNEEDLQKDLDKRKPGQGIAGTKRKESDLVKILSGVFEGKTIGTPIALIVYNEDQKSRDYSNIKDIFRPGHADFTYFKKYSLRDYRGGGRSSGRETVARVAAGAIAKKIIGEEIKILGFVKEIGSIKAEQYNNEDIEKVYSNEFRFPDKNKLPQVKSKIEEAIIAKDSLGGIIEVVIKNVPVGLGEPAFDKLDARLAYALMGVGAVKGIEIGAGFESARIMGSENNDEMQIKNNKASFATNNSGGILGGISNGNDIVLRVAIKPTPSIEKAQNTITIDNKEQKIEIFGRHDICIAPRILPVVEGMIALVLADFLLEQRVQNTK